MAPVDPHQARRRRPPAAGTAATHAVRAQVQASWLRTKGRDSTLGGASVQRMKAWNLWWTVLARGDGGGQSALYTLRCFADESLAVLKVRAPPAPRRRAKQAPTPLERPGRAAPLRPPLRGEPGQ